MGARFDHVSKGDGVVDNWSGASLLPSLLQSLKGEQRRHTFVFVAFSGEEDGLKGSDYYVRHLSKEKLSGVEAMINLDTLGLGPTKVWVSQSDPRLVKALGALAQAKGLPLAGVNVDLFGESDEESFIKAKVCTITVHSLTSETAHVLHSSDDRMSAISVKDYYDTYRLLAGYLAVLDERLKPDEQVCNVKPVVFH